jgi:hypothetical protein
MKKRPIWNGDPQTEPKYTAEELEEMEEREADNWRETEEDIYQTLKDYNDESTDH